MSDRTDNEMTPWTSLDLYYKGVHVKKSLPQNVKIEDLVKTIDTYLEAGFKPSWNEDTNTKATGKITQAGSQTPICGVHGTVMTWKTGLYKTTTAYHKAGDPFAFWSCPTKNADGSYCDYKPKK